MIKVKKQPEPNEFDVMVRKPGLSSLKKRPGQKSKDFEKFWKKSIDDLYNAYNGICAYSSIYFTRHYASVDHYIPKTKAPDLAYEWDNYRLASQRINQYKSDSEDILDPFTIENGWFIIDFPTCLIKPNNHVSSELRFKIKRTIELLKLNNDDILVQDRFEIIKSFAEGEIKLDFLRKRYPFIAFEVDRQKLNQVDIKKMIRYPKKVAAA